MIHIKKTTSKKSITEKLKSLKHSHASGTEKVTIQQSPFFDKLLEVTQVEHIKMELSKLLEEIDSAGRRFSSEPDMDNLKQYKTLITSFLDITVNKMFKIRNITNWIKNKEYVLIEKINEKLAALTHFVLEKQNENINLLSTLDEIRGLLVDLYK